MCIVRSIQVDLSGVNLSWPLGTTLARSLARSVSSMSRKASLPSSPPLPAQAMEGRGEHPATQRIVNAFPFPLTLAIVLAPARATE